MRRGIEIGVLVVVGLAILFTGITGLVSPQALFTPLDLRIEGVAATNEIRSAYGGMHVAVGLLLLAGAGRTSLRRTALWTGFAFTAGLTAGRLVSLGIDGPPGPFVLQLLLAEGIGAIALGLLLLGSADADAPA